MSNLFKVSAKNRLSEEKAKGFAFLSERFLFKPKTIQNKILFLLLLTFPVGVDFQFPSASDFQLLRCRITWAKPKYD